MSDEEKVGTKRRKGKETNTVRGRKETNKRIRRRSSDEEQGREEGGGEEGGGLERRREG